MKINPSKDAKRELVQLQKGGNLKHLEIFGLKSSKSIVAFGSGKCSLNLVQLPK